MLYNLSIILVRPRFPENIGMVARAMANMGASDLVLISPERWSDAAYMDKASALATPQGRPLLDKARVGDDLASVLAPYTAAFGTTARLGGHRKEALQPERCAVEARSVVREGGRVALVFGSEDRGLTNDEADLCTRLVNIPTVAEHTSLNLAQAALVLLYECVKADAALPFVLRKTGEGSLRSKQGGGADSRRATLAEEQLLLRALEDALMRLEYLPKNNPDWFMQPMRRFLRKSRLRRHEFDMLMGICRQIRYYFNS